VRLRPSSLAFAALGLAMAGFAATFLDAALLREHGTRQLAERAALAARLGLTDLALFTEARYTRHPSQADLHSAFQDHPLALEHFPTGSLLPPPAALVSHHARLDRKAAPSD
jgi:hypothetical protein